MVAQIVLTIYSQVKTQFFLAFEFQMGGIVDFGGGILAQKWIIEKINLGCKLPYLDMSWFFLNKIVI